MAKPAFSPGPSFLPGPDGLCAVLLVGAGPGDPDLLTVRAARAISEADIIFTDRLVGEDVLKLADPTAEIVPVGKSKGEHSVPQAEIERRLVEAARAGRRVVRLKGGDPYVFGRGGEEVEALRAAGLRVEVIPGVSAAMGAAASVQIPLTHRDMAQAVTFVTGHAALGAEPDLDWTALARPNQTVVVYMGLGAAPSIAARLIAAGRAAETPVAVIENATRDSEKRAFGRLGELSRIIQGAGIEGPALLVIGEVAALADRASTTRPHPELVEGGRPIGRTAATAGPRSPSSDKHRMRAEQAPAPGEGAPSLSDLWSLLS